MLQPNSDTSFYLNGQLIDTNYLDYQVQMGSTGATVHKKKQAVSKLRIVAYGLKNGWGDDFSEAEIQRWIRDCQ